MLRDSFQRLRFHGLTAGPGKCFIGLQSIKYIGLKLGNYSIAPLEDRVKAVSNINLPVTKTNLRLFIILLIL